MNALRKVLLWVTSGGLLGAFLGSLITKGIAPKVYAPISKQVSATLCDCAAAALAADAMFQWTSIGILVGAVTGLVLGLIAAMASRGKKPDATADASAKPT